MTKTKCWKKTSSTDSSVSYFNQKSSREIQINKTDFGNRGTFGRKRNPKWTLSKFKNNRQVPILKNKSKETILKSANKYMKKHDKC